MRGLLSALARVMGDWLSVKLRLIRRARADERRRRRYD
jgi:hypothetical protein